MGQHKWRELNQGLATKTAVKFDPDGTAIIRTVGDEQPSLAYAKALRDLGDNGWIMGRDVRRVAHIPAALVVKWLVEEGIDVYDPDHAERVMRKLNDPDNAYIRTAPGHLAMRQDGESFR